MRKCRRCRKPFNGSHYQVGNDGICSRCHEKEYMLPKEWRGRLDNDRVNEIAGMMLGRAMWYEAAKAVESVIGENAKKREKECERQGRLIELRRFEALAAMIDARIRRLHGIDEFIGNEKRELMKK